MGVRGGKERETLPVPMQEMGAKTPGYFFQVT
jgi:hypothetical protein